MWQSPMASATTRWFALGSWRSDVTRCCSRFSGVCSTGLRVVFCCVESVEEEEVRMSYI